MSFPTDEYLIKTLENYSESQFSTHSNPAEISGWQNHLLLHMQADPLPKASARGIRRSSKENRLPSLLKQDSKLSQNLPLASNKTQRYSSKQENRSASKCSTRRPETSIGRLGERPISLNCSLRETLSKTKKLQLNLPVQRKFKLQDLCDKNFLIMAKCPPVVSGFSVIFYPK